MKLGEKKTCQIRHSNLAHTLLLFCMQKTMMVNYLDIVFLLLSTYGTPTTDTLPTSDIQQQIVLKYLISCKKKGVLLC